MRGQIREFVLARKTAVNNPEYISPPGLWKKFRRDRLAVAALIWVIILLLTGLLAPFLANDLPLTCVKNGERYFPAFQPKKQTEAFGNLAFNRVQWEREEIESVVWPLVPYKVGNINGHRLFSPFSVQKPRNQANPLTGKWHHQLGTDARGRDILAILIHGTRISLSVGILAVGIAAIIGIFLGAIAGYWGDRRLKVSRGIFLLSLPGVFLGWFYGFRVRQFSMEDAAATGIGDWLLSLLTGMLIFLIVLVICLGTSKWLSRISWLKPRLSLPVDSAIMRLIEILNSIPILMLIISLTAVFSKNIWLVMIAIGLMGWTGIARLVRAEMLKITQLGFVESAHALGFREFRIMFRHALPNALPPVLIVIAFSIGNAIIAESALSFLNITDETATWGRLLSNARSHWDAWWIGVFPGLMIFLTVLSFNLIGERLRDMMDPHTD